MTPDFLDQLADMEVPTPPVEFNVQLHKRVNRSLVLVQVLDLLLGAVPWALVHFVRALLGSVRFSLTGRYEPPRRDSFDS